VLAFAYSLEPQLSRWHRWLGERSRGSANASRANDVLNRGWQAYFRHIGNEMLRAPPRQGKPEQTVRHKHEVNNACQLNVLELLIFAPLYFSTLWRGDACSGKRMGIACS